MLLWGIYGFFKRKKVFQFFLSLMKKKLKCFKKKRNVHINPYKRILK